ncbi:alpha/beta hydrolase [Yoonia sp. BS5-3]|uniref:Alpha/beta fold hydrolase n=1 Tax=Yoonia phaeophyticola TaxID=3137369 RepID=A0ABZ2V9X6_9RHOB
MLRGLRRLVIGCAVVLAALFTVSEIWPQRAAGVLISGLNAFSGLQPGVVETSFGPVQYLEGGEGDTVVFLHGIFARKEHWIDMSRQVSDGYRVILLDLPGFGDNPQLEPAAYEYERQVQNVMQALDNMDVSTFHIAANSMGAQIAGQIATDDPSRVLSVAFIGSPVGVSSPIASDMELALANGEAPLVATTQAIYDERMAWLFPKEPFLPRPIARSWAAAELENGAYNAVIWEAVNGSNVPPLEDLAPDIAQPSLIVWCDQDRIFHISGADVLHQALPDSTMVTPAGCGHLPMLDQPVETGGALRRFLDQQS